MSLHVVIGSGPIGSAVARLLADEGEQVRVVTRSGTGPVHRHIERVAADATDAVALTALARDAVALYNAANPPYARWPELWPPLAAAILHAAEATGAVLATMSNMYGYGPVQGPMTEDSPLVARTAKGRVRAAMWQDALAAHRAGRVRATEARAADYVGAGTKSMMTDYLLPNLLRGKPVRVPADLDAKHSFSYAGDAARTLVTIARDERAWGGAWHVPNDAPSSIRALVELAGRYAGVTPAKLSRVPDWQLTAASLVAPKIRAFNEMSYQFTRPFVVDSSRVEQVFGLKATPLTNAIRESVDEIVGAG
jgi:nucleoside-diphosphate-sugar epimerase